MKNYFALLLLVFAGCKAPQYQVKFTNYSGVPVDVYETTKGKAHRLSLAPGEWDVVPLPEVRKTGAFFTAEGKWNGRTVGFMDYEIPAMQMGYDGFYYPPPVNNTFNITTLNPLIQWDKKNPNPQATQAPPGSPGARPPPNAIPYY